MSDTIAALRAAREVQADVLAPELFREAQEWFFKAKQEYKFKNFMEAQQYLAKAQKFAEDAEFQAIQEGASRTAAPPDPLQSETNIKSAAPIPSEQNRDAGYEDKNKPIYMDSPAGGSGGDSKSGDPKP